MSVEPSVRSIRWVDEPIMAGSSMVGNTGPGNSTYQRQLALAFLQASLEGQSK
jgi:hypothetical protein